jgi:hypothetical protein
MGYRSNRWPAVHRLLHRDYPTPLTDSGQTTRRGNVAALKG